MKRLYPSRKVRLSLWGTEINHSIYKNTFPTKLPEIALTPSRTHKKIIITTLHVDLSCLCVRSGPPSGEQLRLQIHRDLVWPGAPRGRAPRRHPGADKVEPRARPGPGDATSAQQASQEDTEALVGIQAENQELREPIRPLKPLELVGEEDRVRWECSCYRMRGAYTVQRWIGDRRGGRVSWLYCGLKSGSGGFTFDYSFVRYLCF